MSEEAERFYKAPMRRESLMMQSSDPSEAFHVEMEPEEPASTSGVHFRPNPMMQQSKRTHRRIERIEEETTETTTIFGDDDNQRVFFVNMAKEKVRNSMFDGKEDEFYTRAFVCIFDRLRFLFSRSHLKRKQVPYVTIFMVSVSSVMFGSLIMTHDSAWGGAGYVIGWFLPRYIASADAVLWGAATRCALAAGDGYRVFTSHFVNVSSNTFCCGIMGLMAWGGYAESRYGSGVFLMITLFAMSGGCLLASSLMKSTDIVCGMNACNAAYANLTLLDTYFDKCIRAMLKKAVTGLVALFTIYAIVSGTFAGFLLFLGGVLSSLFPVYLVQDSFVGEKADVIICTTAASFTTVYFVAFISMTHSLACN